MRTYTWTNIRRRWTSLQADSTVEVGFLLYSRPRSIKRHPLSVMYPHRRSPLGRPSTAPIGKDTPCTECLDLDNNACLAESWTLGSSEWELEMATEWRSCQIRSKGQTALYLDPIALSRDSANPGLTKEDVWGVACATYFALRLRCTLEWPNLFTQGLVCLCSCHCSRCICSPP